MFAARSIARSSRAALSPMSLRATSGSAKEGGVAVDKSFSQREKSQEDFYIRQRERELLEARKAKAEAELKAAEREHAEFEAKHGKEDKKQ